MPNRSMLLPVFLLAANTFLFGQLPPACSGSSTTSDDCSQACIDCSLVEGFFGSTGGFTSGNGDAAFCSSVDNDQWFAFVAAVPNPIFTVIPNNCQGQIQIAVYEACGGQPLACEPGTGGIGALPVSISPTLTPGHTYYFRIDGSAGFSCPFNFRVEPVGGINALNVGQAGAISGPASLCPGQTGVYSIAAVPGAGAYTWSVPAGWLVNGQAGTVTVIGSQSTAVTVTAGQNGATLEVLPRNACKSGGSSSIQIGATSIPVTVLPARTFCPEEFAAGINILGVNVTQPGTYQATFPAPNGCDSVVQFTVNAHPMNMTQLPPINLPAGQCFLINNHEYCLPGNFEEVFTGANGCDSIVKFTITGCSNSVNISGGGILTCTTLSVQLTANVMPASSTSSWSGPSGFSANSATITVSQPGTYTVTATDPSSGCTATSSITVMQNIAPAGANAGPPGILRCPDLDTDTLIGSSAAGNLANYSWSGPGIVSGATNDSVIVDQVGTYTLLVTRLDNGCTGTASTTVSDVTDLIANAGPDKFFNCKLDTILLDGSLSSSGPGVKYLWTGPGIVAGDAAKKKPRVFAVGTYTLQVSKKIGVDTCYKFDTVVVGIDQDPPIASAGNDTTLSCTGTAVKLTASANVAAFKAQWSGPGIDKSNKNSKTPTVFNPGVYSVTITDLSNFCTDTDDVTVSPAPGAPTASAGPDMILPQGGGSVTLDGSGSSSGAGITYLWAGPGINAGNRNLQNPTVGVAGGYVLKVTIGSGQSACSARDRALVSDFAMRPADGRGVFEENSNLSVRGIFAPELGERLAIGSDKALEIKAFRVVDQFGKQVFFNKNFQPNDEDSSWNGFLANGSPAPAGVYFWTAETNSPENGVLMESGKVVLVR